MAKDLSTAVISTESILATIAEMSIQMQQGQSLEELLQWTITTARNLLKTDRMLLYRILGEQDAVVAFESVGDEWTPIQGQLIYDPCLQATWIDHYIQGQTTTISNTHDGTIAPCYAQLLEHLQVQANLVVPILSHGHLWGLLIAHHCRNPREWQPLEVQLLQHIALQLGIAVQLAKRRQLSNQRLEPDKTAPDQDIISSLRQTTDLISTNSCEQELVQATLHKHEAKYQHLIEHLNIGFVVHAPDTRILQCNPAACALLGLSSDQLLGKVAIDPTWQFIREDGTPMPLQEYPVNRVLATCTPLENYVLGVQSRTQQCTWFLVTAFPEFDAPGQVQQVVVTFIDITRLKQAETKLRQLTEAMENALTSMAYLDPQRHYVYVNQAYASIIGYSPEAMVGTSWQLTVYPDDLETVTAAYRQMQQTGRAELETRGLRQDGSLFYNQLVMIASYDIQGQFSGHYCFMKDISEQVQLEADRKRAEAALERAVLQSNALFAASIDGIVVLNQQGNAIQTSASFARMLGYSVEETLKLNVADWDAQWSKEELDQMREAKAIPPILETQHRRRDGSIYDVEISWSQVELEGERLDFCICRDISERKKAEIALQNAQARFAGILEIASDAIISVNAQQQITLFNQGAERIFGYTAEEAIGQSLSMLLPDRFTQAHTQHINQYAQAGQMARPMAQRGAIFGRRKDGTEFPAEASISQLTLNGEVIFTAFLRDISERQRAEAALQESEARYRSVIAAMAEGIVLQQADGSIMAFNATAERILGLTSDQLTGKSSMDLDWRTIREDGLPFPGETHPAMMTLKTGQPQTQVVMGICKGKSVTTWISINSQPLFHPGESLPYAVVTSFADITALKQAELALKWQSEQQALLMTIAQHLRQSLDLDCILTTTVAEVQKLLQVDRVIIYQFTPGWSGSIIAEAVTDGWRSLLGLQITDTYFATTQGQAYKDGRVKATNDIYTAQLDPCHIELLEQMQVRAKLVVPILQADHLWGLLVAQQCNSPRSWQASEIELQQRLATQIAIAIQQAELYQQVQTLNTNLELQVQERTAQLQQALEFEALLKRITDQIRDSLDEEQILQTVVQELAITMGVDCCDTTIYNADRTTATVRCEYAQEEFTAKKLVFTISDSSDTNLYIQLAQGQYCHFCLTCPNVIRPNQPPKAILACPITDDQGILGDLWLFKSPHDTFNEQEIRLVQQIANQCAIALRQSRLYQAAQAQVQELERLHQLKDDFLSTVSHELRTPMSSIKMATQMLEISLAPLGVLDDEANAIYRYVKILRDEGQREIALINDLLDLTRLDAGFEPLRLTPIDLQFYIPHLTEVFVERTQQQQQQLVIDIPNNLPSLVTDLPYLERLLTELLHNACKYTPAGETITVTAQAVSGTFQICVSNTGVEIPATERERIFDKFYRIPSNDPWKHGGTGLGLALVKKLTQRLGGEIHVISDAGQTTFRLEFKPAHEGSETSL